MKKIPFIYMLVLFNMTFGQENKTISFDFGYGIQQHNMNTVNQFYIDSFAATSEEDLLRTYIKKGHAFRLGANYIPIAWLEAGFYGNYQFTKLTSLKWNEYYDNTLGEIIFNKNYFELKTQAASFGMSTTFYLNELFSFKDSVNNRFLYGIELNGGISFLKISTSYVTKTFTNFQNNDIYTSQSFHGQIGLKLEYNFTQQPIFTTLGIRGGYQFLKSGVVRDAAGQDWLINDKHPITLDFSGFYFGVYLKIGK